MLIEAGNDSIIYKSLGGQIRFQRRNQLGKGSESRRSPGPNDVVVESDSSTPPCALGTGYG